VTLDLNDGVVVECAVQRMKIVIGSLSPVVGQVSPIQMVVVNECTIKNQSAVGLQGTRNHVCRFGVSAAVRRWS
jgi:hypothetical protein